MPRRTRALPALARPCSRRLAPLSSGEPVRPAPGSGHWPARGQAPRATALRSRIGRESTSWTSISAVSTPTPTTRARCRTMACGPLSGSCSNRFSSISLIWLMTNPRRAMSRCSSAKPFGGSGMPSGVCSVARRSAAPRLRGGRPAQGWFEIANAQPGQRGLHSVHDARAFPDQAPALPVRPLGVLFGHRRDARHAAMTPFLTQPPQERPLQQLGVEPVGLGPAMFPRYRDTRGMDHMRLHPTRTQPPRQPEAVAAGFEGQRNPRDLFTSPDCLIAPAKQQAKEPFGTRFQLLARLTLNAGKHTGNQPARLAHLDDGNDCAILVQGDEGPAQVVRLGHQGTPSVGCSDDGAISSPPAPYHLFAGGRRIRTFGSWSRDGQTIMGDGTACLENGGGSVGEPKVRIHLPPAGSLKTFGPSRVAAIESVAEPETRAADHAVKSRLERPAA